jgi:hypothetical protein
MSLPLSNGTANECRSGSGSGLKTAIPAQPARQDAKVPAGHARKDECVMAITIAEKVLITGGVLNLAYALLLGYAITVIRAKGAPATPRYLMAAHISTLLHAAVLLGLV